MKPFFSVIVPVYNVAPYVAACLDSVLGQNFNAWECICIDDGSTDASGRILDKYAAIDSRFKVIHQTNLGVCSARNRGLRECIGEWIIFLDADDIIHPQTLATYNRNIKNYNAVDIIRSRVIQFEGGGAPFAPIPEDIKVCKFDVTSVIEPECFYGFFCQGAFRADLHKGHYFGEPEQLTVGEDNLYYAQALVISHEVLVIDAIVYGYRKRGGSATNSHRDVKKWRDDIIHYEEVFRIFSESGKRFVKSIVREYSRRVTEGLIDNLEAVEPSEWQTVWRYLMELYRKSYANPALPVWRRLTMFCIYWLNSRCAYKILCVIPKKFRYSRLNGLIRKARLVVNEIRFRIR